MMYKSILIALLLLTIGCGQKNASSLLGKDIQSNETQSYLASFPGRPTISEYDSGKHVYYNFESDGISLSFTNGTLVGIFYYDSSTDGFAKYKGELPFQLSFDLTRREVESMFGKPDNIYGGLSNGVVDLRTQVCYSSKRIGMQYRTFDREDLDAKIAIINIQATGCKKR
ncbi:MAG: hypothetical protein QX191_08585 [Methylococcaceae bacterium]|nr:hypothetical protein [Methylococcales bacterium]